MNNIINIVKTITQVKKYKFIFNAILIFIALISFANYFSTGLKRIFPISENKIIQWIHTNENGILFIFTIFLCFYFVILALFIYSAAAGRKLNWEELNKSIGLLSDIGIYYLLFTQILANFDVLENSPSDLFDYICEAPVPVRLMCIPSYIAIVLLLLATIINYVYKRK